MDCDEKLGKELTLTRSLTHGPNQLPTMYKTITYKEVRATESGEKRREWVEKRTESGNPLDLINL